MDTQEMGRMEAEAAALDGEFIQAAGPEAQAEAQQFDAVAEARTIIGTVATLTGKLFPWTAPIYTPETVEQLAQAWGPVMQHYNLSAGRFMSHPLAGAAMVTVPVAMATVQAYRAEVARAKPDVGAAATRPGSKDDATVLQREPEA